MEQEVIMFRKNSIKKKMKKSISMYTYHNDNESCLRKRISFKIMNTSGNHNSSFSQKSSLKDYSNLNF